MSIVETETAKFIFSVFYCCVLTKKNFLAAVLTEKNFSRHISPSNVVGLLMNIGAVFDTAAASGSEIQKQTGEYIFASTVLYIFFEGGHTYLTSVGDIFLCKNFTWDNNFL